MRERVLLCRHGLVGFDKSHRHHQPTCVSKNKFRITHESKRARRAATYFYWTSLKTDGIGECLSGLPAWDPCRLCGVLTGGCTPLHLPHSSWRAPSVPWCPPVTLSPGMRRALSNGDPLTPPHQGVKSPASAVFNWIS